jgi:hypothetical protein
MSVDKLTLASQILKALDTNSGLPDIMQQILDEAERTRHPEMYVQHIIEQVKVYPGQEYDDDREQAIALLQQVLQYFDRN